MKWKTIKDKCVHEFYIQSSNQSPTKSSMELAITKELISKGYKSISRKELESKLSDKIISVIDNWDIRNYRKLELIFPDCFPKNIHTIELIGEEWELA